MTVGSPCNAAFRCDGSVNQGAGYFFEDDVTVGAVDHRMECGMERYRMAAAVDFKVGDVHAAVSLDMLQHTLKIILGGERSGNAGKNAEVGVVKGVIAGHRSLRGIGEIPRAERASGVNLSRRERIVKGYAIGQMAVRGQRKESCGVNFESERIVVIGAGDFEQCAVGDDFANAGAGAGMLEALVGIHDGRAAKRRLDMQTVDANESQIPGAEEQIGVAGFNLKTLSGGERREFRTTRGALQNNAFCDAPWKRKEGTVKMFESYRAIECFLQCRDNLGLSEGPIVVKQCGGHDSGYGK